MEEMNTVMNEVVENESAKAVVEDVAMDVAEKVGEVVRNNGFDKKDLLKAGLAGAGLAALIILGAKPAKRAFANFKSRRNIVKPGDKKKSKDVDKNEVVEGETAEVDEPEEDVKE